MPSRGRPRSFDRAAALQRAMMVFWAKGYEGASLPELTRAMGIHSPSLYAAFGSKEALYREAVELYGATEGNEIWDPIPEAPTAREAVERFLRCSAEGFTRRNKPAGCFIALGGLYPADGGSGAARELRRRRTANIAALAERLERAVRDRELAEGTDCRAVARFYITVQQGMSIQARDGASREALLSIADCAMVAWDGLTARPRS